MGYLVDSNVLIDYVAERFNNSQLKALDIIFDEELIISVISKIEILGFKSLPEEEDKLLETLNNAFIIPLDDVVVDATISLKKEIKIKTPDAIIACTALVNDHTLITNNTVDFKRVQGLKIFNPYEL